MGRWEPLAAGECLTKPWWNDGVYPTTAGRWVETKWATHDGCYTMLVRSVPEPKR